jgi:predicted aspartyl protease
LPEVDAMGSERQFHPRREVGEMGQILVTITVQNTGDPSRRVESVGMVDTGAFGLILPAAWRPELEPLSTARHVELETADQRIVTAEVCGPVAIRLDGFERIFGEVVFVDMLPGPRGRYEPLVGYTILESCGAVVDLVTHRLIARKYYDLKPSRVA